MIKENIQININDKSFDAEIIAPSQVMTSTPQEETVDLTKSPNFVLKVQDAEKTINVTDIVEVSFSLGDYNYTANMKAYNRGGGIIALQYDSNLTAEEVTHTFEANAPQLETSKDLNSGDIVGNDTYFMYDGEPVNAADISFGPLNYHTITVGEPTPEDITLTPKSFSEITEGEFVDTLTATYKGMTATVTVTLTITAAPGGELVLNADTYYTAYDISENEDPKKSALVTATFNDEDINPADIEFGGLTYNIEDVRSGNKVNFKPNDVQIDGHPGVYTDDVTAEYQGAQTSCQVKAVAVDTAAQTGLTVDKPYYACSVNQNTNEKTDAHARILYNGTELDPMDVQMSGTYYNQYWVWNGSSGDFMADGFETFHGYDIVTITYNNETISCLLKIDIIGFETPEE